MSVRFRSDWHLEVFVFVEGWKLDNSEQGRTLQLTINMPIQPTCNFNSGNRIRDTLMATVPSAPPIVIVTIVIVIATVILQRVTQTKQMHLYTAVSTKAVQKKCKSVSDNAER